MVDCTGHTVCCPSTLPVTWPAWLSSFHATMESCFWAVSLTWCSKPLTLVSSAVGKPPFLRPGNWESVALQIVWVFLFLRSVRILMCTETWPNPYSQAGSEHATDPWLCPAVKTSDLLLFRFIWTRQTTLGMKAQRYFPPTHISGIKWL